MARATKDLYWEIALARRELPVPCDECEEPVVAGVVHHIDENPDNNERENLMILHRGCHTRIHLSGPKSPAHLAKLKAANRSGAPEVRAKISATLTGVPHTKERRANQSAAQRARFARDRGKPVPALRARTECEKCGGMFNPCWMTRHRQEGKCT